MSSNNPFAPPNAEVADPPSDAPPPPREIRRACGLILVAMVLGLVTLLPGVRPERAGAEDVPAFVTFGLIVFFSGLTIWLALKIYRGSGWARWAMLAYLALGWWLAGSELQETFAGSPVSGLIDVVCIAMEAVACALLTLGNGARWFSQLAERRRARRGDR
jgi:hypothetical protein